MATTHGEKRSHTAAFDAAKDQASKRIRIRNHVEQQYISNFKSQLSRFKNACTFCHVYSVDSRHHPITHCPTLSKEGGFGAYKAWKDGLHYDYDGICWKCQLPNGPHDVIHPPFGKKIPCQYPDLVVPLVYAALSQSDVRQLAATHFGQSFEQRAEVLTWMTASPSKEHLSNLTAFFLWYAATF